MCVCLCIVSIDVRKGCAAAHLLKNYSDLKCLLYLQI